MNPPSQDELLFIKNIILTKPTYMAEVPFRVNNYGEAVKLWGEYKRNKSISIENICKSAKKASEAVSCLDAQSKNNCLTKLIDDINLSREEIKNANTVDIDCIEKSNEKAA